jgi:hypothetical protein
VDLLDQARVVRQQGLLKDGEGALAERLGLDVAADGLVALIIGRSWRAWWRPRN